MSDNWHAFINDMIALEDRAHRLGLHATGHALNDAKKKAGYERADQLGKLGQNRG